MRLTEAQSRLIIDIDKTAKHILAHDGDDETILKVLLEQMPAIRNLIGTASTEERDRQIQRYQGLYHYIKLLENLAQGLTGVIKTPR
jgi:hypothetical protein